MKLITRWMKAAEMVRDARENVRRYLRSGLGDSPRDRALAELGENPNPDDVDRIAGDQATALHCDECKEPAEELVEIGEPLDYGSSTAHVCAKCLLKAMQLINP